jgi:hypothetical protein
MKEFMKEWRVAGSWLGRSAGSTFGLGGRAAAEGIGTTKGTKSHESFALPRRLIPAKLSWSFVPYVVNSPHRLLPKRTWSGNPDM